MKTTIFKNAILLGMGAALSATLVACSDSSKGDDNQSGLSNKAREEKEFTEPGSAEEMANQTFRLKTDRQEFVLKKLAHMVWAKYGCTAKIADGDKIIDGLVTVSFYPTFDIKTVVDGKEKVVVSPDEACGRKLPREQNSTIPTGLLLKDEANQYNLQYGLPGQPAPILTMKWDTANTAPGELTCASEDGKLSKVELTTCTIIPVPSEPTPTEPSPEVQH